MDPSLPNWVSPQSVVHSLSGSAPSVRGKRPFKRKLNSASFTQRSGSTGKNNNWVQGKKNLEYEEGAVGGSHGYQSVGIKNF